MLDDIQGHDGVELAGLEIAVQFADTAQHELRVQL
jgi:hypothetical protein